MKMRPRITQDEYDSIKKIRIENNQKRVLVIGDLHEPFCLEGYFDFCKDIYTKYKCTDVVFIGDIVDNHFSSYHETIPDSIGGGDELEFAISKLKKWHTYFPNATVIIGNHDRLIMRKAQTGGISSKWIRDYKDVLEDPVKLQNYINTHKLDTMAFQATETFNTTMVLKPWYEVYFLKHGPPNNGVFQSELLAQIVIDLIASNTISPEDFINS